MIYAIANPAQDSINYVCPDQQTIDQGQSYGYVGIYSIGGEIEANQILSENRTVWLSANLNLFTVTKDIDPDPIQTTWVVCNLNTEPENADVDYNIFNVLNGNTTTVTGLTNAKELEKNTTETVLQTFVPVDSFDEWEVRPLAPGEPTISIGVQDL